MAECRTVAMEIFLSVIKPMAAGVAALHPLSRQQLLETTLEGPTLLTKGGVEAVNTKITGNKSEPRTLTTWRLSPQQR